MEYFYYISKEVSNWLSGLLQEDTFTLFRRAPQVILGSPSHFGTSDFFLSISGPINWELDKGTFHAPLDDRRVMVYRNPARVRIPFSLYGNGLLSQQKIAAMDKLMAYFFDQPTIPTWVPPALRSQPALVECLHSQRAEFQIRTSESYREPALQKLSPQPFDLFYFAFDYVGLYHSGRPLREEIKTKQRVVDLKENEERRA